MMTLHPKGSLGISFFFKISSIHSTLEGNVLTKVCEIASIAFKQHNGGSFDIFLEVLRQIFSYQDCEDFEIL